MSSQILIETAKDLGIRHHPTGTNITIEGPRFSTKAESKLWRSWGADVINMTTVPEVCMCVDDSSSSFKVLFPIGSGRSDPHLPESESENFYLSRFHRHPNI